MEVQCFEMWSKVKIEKLQNDPNLVSHTHKKSVLMKEFPMSLWLLCILTWKLTWIQTNVCTSKQTTNKLHVWAFKKRDSNHLISQNVHHINHKKDINKWSDRGLICMDFQKLMKWQELDLHGFACLLSQGSLIFINVHWCQWHDQRLSIGWTTQVPAPPPGAASSCSWWADQLRTKDITPHKGTCSLLTLHDHWCSFCSFSIVTLSHILKYCPFPIA